MIEQAGRSQSKETLLADRSELCRRELLAVSAELEAAGIPGTKAEGQLLRPLIALAQIESAGDPPTGFWQGILAIQLAHEASLVHDDVVDDSPRRHSEPSVVAEHGVAAALLRGDHLLSAAYRAAAATGSLDFVRLFARSVERTVAGESEQARAMGRTLEWSRYEAIALGKSGELIGCSLAAAAVLEGRPADAPFELGRRLGLLYQMLDDLLDYCPSAETGKPPLRDYEHRRWTGPLLEVPGLPFGLESQGVLTALHRPAAGESPMRRALARLEQEAARIAETISTGDANDSILQALIQSWVERARAAVDREAEPPSIQRGGRVGRNAAAELLRGRVPPLEGVERYLQRHSRSFRFACRFFPAPEAARIARVYAYCRVTDDLADRPAPGASPADLIDAWEELSKDAYAGRDTGIDLLDRAMGEMAAAAVPFKCAGELCQGMRMDLVGERYETMAALSRYTYRVASVVGLWVTRLFGVHDSAVLSRAAQMGHAMQLTNILRDVGEDWRRGRLYLPIEHLREHGLDEPAIGHMAAGAPITPAYGASIEALLREAEADYEEAIAALPALPPALGRSAAVAAFIYRGIHDELRRLRYDNFRSRAYTSSGRKAWLAMRALSALQTAPALQQFGRVAGGSVPGAAVDL